VLAKKQKTFYPTYNITGLKDTRCEAKGQTRRAGDGKKQKEKI
jgi:hypothetical protein